LYLLPTKIKKINEEPKDYISKQTKKQVNKGIKRRNKIMPTLMTISSHAIYLSHRENPL